MERMTPRRSTFSVNAILAIMECSAAVAVWMEGGSNKGVIYINKARPRVLSPIQLHVLLRKLRDIESFSDGYRAY